MDIQIIGAGIFGVSSALALVARGYRVRLVDVAPPAHPLAASTDISKVVRLEYGSDEEYVRLGERALVGWRRWNVELADEVFHETGVMFLSRAPLAPGGFEHDSWQTLTALGHRPERLSAALIAERYPAWNATRYVDGTYHALGGWVESGRAIAKLTTLAAQRGVTVVSATFAAPLLSGDRARGIVTSDGETLLADVTVLALGAWTPRALPESAAWFRQSAMPVFHLRPDEPSLFSAERFPVFGADIAQTGYYGFPFHPRAGVVKIANHGIGRPLDPSDEARRVDSREEAALRQFLVATFPRLATAPIVNARLCVYCDTWDGHFWIDAHPAHPGLVVATGGSGHALKFGPVLGELVADAIAGTPHPKFRWRPALRPERSDEAARHQG